MGSGEQKEENKGAGGERRRRVLRSASAPATGEWRPRPAGLRARPRGCAGRTACPEVGRESPGVARQGDAEGTAGGSGRSGREERPRVAEQAGDRTEAAAGRGEPRRGDRGCGVRRKSRGAPARRGGRGETLRGARAGKAAAGRELLGTCWHRRAGDVQPVFPGAPGAAGGRRQASRRCGEDPAAVPTPPPVSRPRFPRERRVASLPPRRMWRR